MAKNTGILRKYRMIDADMLSHADVIQGFFMNDVADFSVFDPDLDADFGNDFKESIRKAEGYNSDNQLIDVVATATVVVEENMKECRDFFRLMRYFIEKAFQDNPAVCKEFGFEKYKKCRRSQLDMIQFMYDLHKTAEKYAVQLDAVGFDGLRISGIKSLAETLQSANIEQESLIRERITERENRVGLLNDCWSKCILINKAAKLVYANNYGKQVLYRLPVKYGKKKNKKVADEDIEGNK